MDRPHTRPRLLAGGLTALAVGIPLAIWFVGPSVDCRPDHACDDLDWLRTGAVRTDGLLIHDAEGALISSVGSGRRIYTPIEEIPERIRDAWIGVEDRRFRDHGGVDLWSAARALAANLGASSVQEGASTIPMQLVRTIWIDEVQAMSRWRRKWFEATMAPRLVDELGHRRVLELYLNAIYLGEGVYGVGAAARHYWGRTPDELTVAQIATLVGMTKAPGHYQPRGHPAASRRRRTTVLAQLVDAEVITSEEARTAATADIGTLETAPTGYGWDWVSSSVRRRLDEVVDRADHHGTLNVYTTVRPRMQQAAESLAQDHTRAIASGEYGEPGREAPPQTAVVLMDTRTGAVRALVGGRDYAASQFNRATQAERPVGSLSKPLLMASALDRGVSATDAFSTSTIRRVSSSGVWEPRDHVERAALVPKGILVHSSNRAAVRLGREVGVGTFARTLRRLGVEADVPRHPTAYLGAFDATLMEVTAAYATLGNYGDRVTPHLIDRVEDGEGRVLWRRRLPERVQAVSRVTAFQVVDGLRAAAHTGTGWRAGQATGSPHVAGKTGTTNGVHDAWFVGMTPHHTVGVWIGHDTPGTLVEDGSGGRLATPLWAALMASDSTLAPRLDSVGWRVPAGARQVWVEPASGRITPPACLTSAARGGVKVYAERFRLPRSLDPCRPVRLDPRARVDLVDSMPTLHDPPTIRVPSRLRRSSGGGEDRDDG